MRSLAIAWLMFTVLNGAAEARAQAPVPEKKSGTVKEVTTKNRLVQLTLTDSDGQDHVVQLTPRVKFEVRGTGDEGFVAAGQYIEGVGVVTNDKLFVKAVTVYLLAPGQKAPAGQLAKAPREVGASENSYRFGGTVLGRKPDPDYADYQQLAVKIGGRVPPILLEKDYQVHVVSSSPELVRPGQAAEFELLTSKAGRASYLKVTISLTEPMKSEDVLKPAAKR